MRFLPRCVHAVIVLATVALAGALIAFAIGSAGLRLSSEHQTAVEWSARALPWIMGVLCVWGVWKKVGYRWLFPVLGLSAGFVTYLVYDNAARPVPPEIGRVTPADSKSYAAYRWFLRGDPQSRLSEQPTPPVEIPYIPSDRKEWPAFYATHRDIFTTGWESDALGRAWVDEMAQNAPEGIYPPQKRNAPVLLFSRIRQSAKLRWGRAQVLTLDGRTDDAVNLLLPFLRANYHLQTAGSSLVTQMIALVCVQGTYDQLEVLADSGRLSPAMRSLIATALTDAPLPPVIFHNAFVSEQLQSIDEFELMDRKPPVETIQFLMAGKSSQLPTNKFLWRLFHNPRRSAWEFNGFLREVGRLAEVRRLDPPEAEGREFERSINQHRLKNPIAQMFRQATLPAFGLTAKNVWRTEDRRKALVQRLTAP
ncbi:MAG TPA: hypothetical protein VHO24_10860 [Opitutaceae bacterium]|nr:hypothetical protein [Opitutaceae bacterium]